MLVSIKGLDKALVLKALYDNARAQGLGWLHFDPAPMRVEEARAVLAEAEALMKDQPDWKPYFDYFRGRVMKVKLWGDTLDTWLYDRDNGEGAALRALVGAGLAAEEVAAPPARAQGD